MIPEFSHLSNVHQSGEKVAVPGIYELASATHDDLPTRHTYYRLYHGECFPNYEGRATCWHLVEAVPYHEADEPLNTPWQYTTHQ